METREPIKLKSVVLKNIRRFGVDVEIKFGAGATILIAPNGSGKTAVLEAIELALTSGVKRVKGRWAPLIREGGDDASVQVDFGDWKREVSLSKNNGVRIIKEGKLDEIFGDISPEGIPFLLRLTHLLDQRDSGWFCQQGPEDAGEQLTKLPLGRQASQVNSTVARLRPAVSRRITELTGAIASKQKILGDWRALVHVRDSAQTDLSRPLTPLSVLAQSLALITGLSIPQGLGSVAAIREQWAIVNAANNQALASMVASQGNLAGLVLVPAAYGKIADSLVQLEQELQKEKSTLARHQATETAINESIVAAVASHRELLKKVTQTTLVLERKRAHAKTVALLETQRQQRKMWFRSREQKKTAFDATQQTHSAALTGKDVNAMLEALAGTIALKRSSIAAAKQSYAEWQGAESRRKVEEQNLQARNAEIESLDKNLRIAVAELEQAVLAHQSAKSILAVYQEAAGAIRAAVATVAEKLPIGTDTCPVCLEQHGEHVLRLKIADALNAMDPQHGKATANLRLAAEKLEKAKKSKDKESTALSTAQVVRARVNEAIAAIESDIKIAKNNSILIGLELGEVQGRLDSLQAEVDSDSSDLDAKRSAQEPLLSVEAMTQLTARFNSEKRELGDFDEALARLDETIDDTTEALAKLDPLVTENFTIEQGEQALSSLEEQVRLSAAVIENEQAKKSALARTLLDVDAVISRITQRLELDQARFETQRSKWVSAGLITPPSDEQLEAVKEKLLADKTKAETAQAKLGEIETELSRIAEANVLSTAQQAVDAARGGSTESDYARILMEELKRVQDELAMH
jgi:exonuclease SbcC